MDITRLDITILVATTLGVILMTFVFSGLGLAGDEATASEVPEFDIDTDRFDLVGDFPTRPSGPDGGTLVHVSEGSRSNPLAQGSRNQAWITGDTSDGEFIFVLNENNVSDPRFEVTLQDWDNGNLTNEVTANFTEEGDFNQLNEGDWKVDVTFDRFYNVNESPGQTAEFTYEIANDPTTEDTAWYSGIPVIGDTAEGLQWISRMLVFLTSVVQWFVLSVVQFLWNMAFAIFEVVKFAFDLVSFLTTTYAEISGSSEISPWAQVILLVPGILMMIEWMKVALVLINTIWIG